jgi:ABC-type molybdate transport system ATPase subunit
MREAEDRITLRDNLTPSGGSTSPLFETLADQMNLTSLLDLPLLSLSNGQTRRARIVKAILDNPELLLLDEPLSNYLITYLRNRNIYPSWQLVLTLNHGKF